MTAHAKTGSLGRPWVALEQPRPPAVEDRYAYWSDPPPVLSARCRYWARQIEQGWLPNRRWRAECYDCSAALYGVYLWEYLEVIEPMIDRQVRREATHRMLARIRDEDVELLQRLRDA